MLDPLSGDPLLIDSPEGDLAAARAREQNAKWLTPPASLGILGGVYFDFDCDATDEHADKADGGEGGGGTTGGGGNEADGGEGGEECSRVERPVGECLDLQTSGGDADGGEGTAIVMRAETGGSSSDVGDDSSWAPKTVDELLYAIANFDYGVSDDRSSALASPACKAYNAEAGIYEQVTHKRGEPLREGFWVVKVRAKCCVHDTLHVYSLSP